MKERRCPGCGANMGRSSFERKPLGQVELDICFSCQVIWFDQYESAQLTPGAVLELFRLIHENEPREERRLPEALRCPACLKALLYTQDVQRTNRIAYHRCPDGDGRLSTFFQFLREKNFVRSLSPGEIAQLKARVSQVRCSSCGAPVDLERGTACAFCRAPISILDPDAVRETMAELGAAEERRKRVDPQAAMDALLAGKRFEAKVARIEGRSATHHHDGVDLVNAALHILMSD
jgi:hypothetical protein